MKKIAISTLGVIGILCSTLIAYKMNKDVLLNPEETIKSSSIETLPSNINASTQLVATSTVSLEEEDVLNPKIVLVETDFENNLYKITTLSSESFQELNEVSLSRDQSNYADIVPISLDTFIYTENHGTLLTFKNILTNVQSSFKIDELKMNGTVSDLLKGDEEDIFLLYGKRSEECETDNSGCTLAVFTPANNKIRDIFTFSNFSPYGAFKMIQYDHGTGFLQVQYSAGDGPAGSRTTYTIDVNTNKLISSEVKVYDCTDSDSSSCQELPAEPKSLVFMCGSTEIIQARGKVDLINVKNNLSGSVTSAIAYCFK